MVEKEKQEISDNELEDRKEIDGNGIKIADDVVATIAGKAASEVRGVYSMFGGFAGGISEVFGKKSYTKGIRIVIEEDASLDEILNEISEKFKDSEKFFGKAKTAVAFEGKALTAEEENAIFI